MDKISKKNKKMKTIFKFKKLLKKYNLDAYIIPKNDEFFGEYAFPNRLRTVSNFSGSAGFSIITRKKNYLFVDGRYLIQGKMESGQNFKIIEIPFKYPKDILDYKKIRNIGFDPKLFTRSTLEKYFEFKFNLISINENFVDLIFTEKNRNKGLFYNLDHKIVGETISSKISRIYNIN